MAEEKTEARQHRSSSGTIQIVIVLALVLFGFALPVLWIPAAIYLIFRLYELYYFGSEGFKKMRETISEYISGFNALDNHIEALKRCTIQVEKSDENETKGGLDSEYKFPLFPSNVEEAEAEAKAKGNIYYCSEEEYKEVQERPFECLCKYFGIGETQDSLEKAEIMLNNFEAVEYGKVYLEDERWRIAEITKSQLPSLLKTFTPVTRVANELKLEPTDTSTNYFPRYMFQCTSPEGKVLAKHEIVLNVENLNAFIEYLDKKVTWQKSVAEKRTPMTSELRQHIFERDNFTCKKCGASTERAPHLLLEVDYITPFSKGGITSEDNLQTVCWRCKALADVQAQNQNAPDNQQEEQPETPEPTDEASPAPADEPSPEPADEPSENS